MKAAVVRSVNGPFIVEELQDPRPKADEVLIKVAACGVCHTDLHIHDGSVPFPMPCVLGHEVSGEIVELGEGVDDLHIGQWVAGAFIMPCGRCAMCLGGREELCEPFFAYNRLNGTLYDGETRLFDSDGEPVWMYSMGGLAELAVMPSRALAPIADGLDAVDATIFGCALMTSYGALTHVAKLVAGESVVVLGAGGVGGGIIQVARALGADRIVAVDVAADKLELARELGADDAVNAGTDDVVAVVRELTGGAGVDVAFEAIGRPQTFRQATEMVKDGGRCVMVGIAGVGVLAEVEITRLVRRKLQILGSFGGRPRHDLPALMALAVEGRLKVDRMIRHRFALDEADDAYRRLRAGRIAGRAIVQM